MKRLLVALLLPFTLGSALACNVNTLTNQTPSSSVSSPNYPTIQVNFFMDGTIRVYNTVGTPVSEDWWSCAPAHWPDPTWFKMTAGSGDWGTNAVQQTGGVTLGTCQQGDMTAMQFQSLASSGTKVASLVIGLYSENACSTLIGSATYTMSFTRN